MARRPSKTTTTTTTIDTVTQEIAPDQVQENVPAPDQGPSELDKATLSLSVALDYAMDSAASSTGAIAKIACSIVHLFAIGNGGPVTIKSDTGTTVDLSPSLLDTYARGKLPKALGEALPRDTDVLGVFRAMSPAVTAKRAAYDKAVDKARSGGLKKLDDMRIERADVDNTKKALDAVRKTINDGVMLAAYVLNLPDNDTGQPYYDFASAKEYGGKLSVAPHVAQNDGQDPIREEVTHALAKESYKASRKPRSSKANTSTTTSTTTEGAPLVPITGIVLDASDSAHAVVVRAEALRRGGPDRAKLAETITALAGMLSDIDGKPTTDERHAMIRLFNVCESYFGDEDFARIAELRDERAEMLAATSN